jgi:hypothetical protein
MLDGNQFKAQTCPSFKPAVTYTGDEAEGLWFCRSEAIAAKRMHRSKSGMAVWHLSALEVSYRVNIGV